MFVEAGIGIDTAGLGSNIHASDLPGGWRRITIHIGWERGSPRGRLQPRAGDRFVCCPALDLDTRSGDGNPRRMKQIVLLDYHDDAMAYIPIL